MSLVLSAAIVPTASAQSGFDDPSFSWDGFYAGVGLSVGHFSTGETVYMPEVVGGFNVTIDQLLLGAEATVSQGLASTGWGAFQATGKARAGLLVTDAVLIYTSGGIGYYCIPNTVFGVGGGGVEIAITDTMSVDFEYEYWMRPGQTAHSADMSLLFHF